MVAGFLVVLVFIDTFLTGWLIRNTIQLQTYYHGLNKQLDELGNVVAVHEHDLEKIVG